MKIRQFVVALVTLLAGTAAAQENTRFDVALSFAAVFSKTVSSASSTVTDSPTTAGKVLGTVGYHFNHLTAVEGNIGHVRNSQIFTITPDTYRIVTDIYEYSGAFVVTPYARKKLQPLFFAGAGGLRFSPAAAYIDTIPGAFGTAPRTSFAFLYGGGADYRVLPHVSVRLQYRGLVYRNPDFGDPSRFYTGGRGHMAEPGIGIVAKF
jgi:opacity protein-like surface antigen